MNQYVIYKITNPIGQIYIGQTYNYSKRILDYSKLRCRSQRLLYSSLLEFGFSEHEIEVYKLTTLEESNKDEIEAIRLFNSYNGVNPKGLNLIPGGRCITYKGHEMPESVKQSIRVTLTGRTRSKEECNNIRLGKLGKKVNRITVEKSAKGRFKPVLQYTLDGQFIKEWESTRTVNEVLGIRRTTISNCCYGHSNHAGGFIWRSKTANYPINITPPRSKRQYRNTIKSIT